MGAQVVAGAQVVTGRHVTGAQVLQANGPWALDTAANTKTNRSDKVMRIKELLLHESWKQSFYVNTAQFGISRRKYPKNCGFCCLTPRHTA